MPVPHVRHRTLAIALAGATVGALGGFLAASDLATPTLALDARAPIRFEYSHAHIRGHESITCSFTPGPVASTYRGTAEVVVGMHNGGRETLHVDVVLGKRDLDRLSSMLRGLKLSRAAYEPTTAVTDDYPRHLLVLPIQTGVARFEMASQDRDDWFVTLLQQRWRAYAVRSHALAAAFDRIKQLITQGEIKAAYNGLRHKYWGDRINEAEKLDVGDFGNPEE